MENIRFSYVWWHYTDDGDEIDYFILNNKTNKILDIKTEKIYEIDPNNIFKSIKNIYGNKGRIDDTFTILNYYIFRTGSEGYRNCSIYGEYYRYVNKYYLEDFAIRLQEEIKKKQEELLQSIHHCKELEF